MYDWFRTVHISKCIYWYWHEIIKSWCLKFSWRETDQKGISIFRTRHGLSPSWPNTFRFFQITLSVSPPTKDEIDMGNILNPDDPQSSSGDDLALSATINLDTFLRQTEVTLKQLKDPEIVSTPGKLSRVLNAWATELNHSLLAYHLELCRQQLLHRRTQQAGQSASSGTSQAEEVKDRKSVPQNIEGIASTNVGDVVSKSVKGSAPQYDEDISPDMESGSSTDPNIKDTEANNNVAKPGSPDEIITKAKTSVSDEGTAAADEDAVKRTDVEPPRHNSTEESVVCNGSVPHLEKDSAVLSKTQDNDKKSTEDSRSEKLQMSSQQHQSKEEAERQGSEEVSLSAQTHNEEQQKGESVDGSDVDLHVDWSRVCHVRDPFHLPPQQHMMVSNLVTHCFDCHCFGNTATIFAVHTPGPKKIKAKEQACESVPSSFQSFSDTVSSVPSQADVLKSSQDTFHSHGGASDPCLNSSMHTDLLPSTSVLENPEKESTCLVPVDHVSNPAQKSTPHFLDCDKSKGEDGGGGEKLDAERALFVRLYFHFLPLWRLRRLVVESDGKSVSSTWRAVVTCSQGVWVWGGFGGVFACVCAFVCACVCVCMCVCV